MTVAFRVGKTVKRSGKTRYWLQQRSTSFSAEQPPAKTKPKINGIVEEIERVRTSIGANYRPLNISFHDSIGLEERKDFYHQISEQRRLDFRSSVNYGSERLHF